MAKDHQQLWEGVTNETEKAQGIRGLAEILADKEGRGFISGLERKEAELYIGILDHGIAEHNLKPPERDAFFVTWRKLAERHGLLPDRVRMTEEIEVSDEIIGSGGFADVRCGRYIGNLVAVKTTRVGSWANLQKTRKRFYKGVVLWSTISHPNVLKLVGAQEDITKRRFVNVSEWMEHGTVMDYIKKMATNRLELLHGAAQGLEYLHGVGLAHGSLKGRNIFVSNDTPPRACLDGSPFMTVVADPVRSMECSAQTWGGTTQFMAPELLVPEDFGEKKPVPTQQADIYAFGMVVFQVLTGETPFCGIPSTAMGYHVLRGMRPDKPENAAAIGFTDPLWGFTERCWDGKREARPEAGEVVTHLGEAAVNWGRVMPPCPQAEYVAYDSEGSTPDSEGPDPFALSPIWAPENPTESETNSGLFSLPSTPTTR